MDANNKDYDVLVTYSAADRGWVTRWLLPRLTREGVRVTTDEELFVIGDPGLRNIERAFQFSPRVIVVLTPDYVAAPENLFATDLLQVQDPRAIKRRLLPLLLRPCELPPAITALKLHCADFTTEENWERAVQHLIRDIEGTVRPPAPPPGQSRFLWRRWRRYNRRRLTLGMAASMFALLALWIGFQAPPFQPRGGWHTIGLNDPGAQHLYNVNGVLLATTDTTEGCDGPDTGLRRSEDRGQTWPRVPVPELDFGVPCDRALISSLVPTPGDPIRLYAATSNVGLLQSDDLGKEWQRVGEDTLPKKELVSVAVVPAAPEQIFVTGDPQGLWRSSDGGARWESVDDQDLCRDKNQGINLPLAAARLGLLLAASDAVYVGPAVNNSAPALDPAAGLYMSHDGGTCWQRVFSSEGKYNFERLVASPIISDEIFFVIYDRADTGKHWLVRYNPRSGAQRLWETDVYVRGIVIAADGKTWYAVKDNGEVWTGLVDNDEVRAMSGVPCGSCYADLARGFGEMPLLLADGRVFEWGQVSWLESLRP